MHIDNLYKDLRIMEFKECFALEKIHGTSAHISWKDNKIIYFSGGEKHLKFVNYFDDTELQLLFEEHFFDMEITLFGEAYGGSQQGMSDTYGKELKFIVFDVKIEGAWLNVLNAENVTKKMNLEFVDYLKITTDLEAIDAERNKPSVQATRNGIEGFKKREGIVLRPLEEYSDKRGNRIITKHKNAEFSETKTVREVSPEKLKVLEEARAIGEEWVTEMRLTHILDKLGNPNDISAIRDVIKNMIEDVLREAKGEIIESQAAKKAIGTKTALMFKNKISKIGEGR